MSKLRKARIYDMAPPKKGGGEIAEDASQHLWAISYSDLLMVLLTFFVIYFQFDDVVQVPKSLQNVVTALKADEKYAQKVMEGAQKAKDGKGDPSIPTKLVADLKAANMGLSLVETPQDVVIYLRDDLYPSGKYEMGPNQQYELTKVLKIVKPYVGDLSLVFIGHTDAVRLKKKGVVDTNLALSSLRAVRAEEFALWFGLDPQYLSTQGSAEYGRNSRSLSIKLIPRTNK